jgi:CHAT domain-containing protein/tetratricopeptide (TPR) repeat protein
MKGVNFVKPTVIGICLQFLLATGIFSVARSQLYLDSRFIESLSKLKRENQFAEACKLLDLQYDSLIGLKDTRPALENRLRKADFFRMEGQYTESGKLLDSLYTFYFNNKSACNSLYAYYNMIRGTLCLTRGDLENGRKNVLQAIISYNLEFGADDTLLAPCYNKLGNYYYYSKNYDSALFYYNKALGLIEKNPGNLEDRASYLQNIGIIYLEYNEFSKAESHFLKSLQIKEAIYSPNSYSLGRIYLNLGRFYQGISSLEKALFYLEKAEVIFLKDGSNEHTELGTIYWNKGVISNILGDHEIAYIYLFNAKNILEAKLNGNNKILSPLLMDLGLAYDKNSDAEKAISFYNSSLVHADTSLKIKIYRNLANLYFREGDFEKSENYFDKLKKIIHGIGARSNPDDALTYLYYGEFLMEKGDPHSLEYLNKAYGIFRKNLGFHNRDVAASLQSLGDYYLKQGSIMLALNYYQQGLMSISKTFADTNILANPSAGQLNTDLFLVHILSLKASSLTMYYNQTGNDAFLISSVQTYLLCLDMIDQLRMTYRAENSQMNLAGLIHEINNQAIDNCLTAFNCSKDSVWLYKAFEISERGKSVVLLSELKDANAKKLGSVPENLKKNEKTIKSNICLYRNNIWEEENQKVPNEKKLDYYRENLLAYEIRYDSLTDYLERVYPDYYRLKYDPSVVSVKELQGILEEDEVIVEYTMAKDYLFTFLVYKNHFEVLKTPVDSSFIPDIFKLRGNLNFRYVPKYSMKEYMEYQHIANKLYSLLIQPVDNHLIGKRVIIIPDEELSYLSFESLTESIMPSDTISFRNLPYLIKKYPISYAASSTILALIKKGPAPYLNNGVLALAPTYDIMKSSLFASNQALVKQLSSSDDLPGAAWEVETILKIIKGKDLEGEYATEYEFKKLASSFDILHFAMHTKIDDENPLSSMLSFYPLGGHGEDNVLHTYEIYNMDLQGELAFLSACSTGNGKLQKGEGVLSLARAFTYAGMPSVVMTLWDVEDISSGNIIPCFYQLLTKGFPKDVALRQAKLNYMEKTKPEIELHPAFWSGFVLYGNNRGFRQGKTDLYVILLSVSGGLILILIFILIRKYRNFRKNFTQIGNDLPIEFRAKDRV